MDTYSKRLLWAINHAGLSQTELAKRTGVTPQTIQYLCSSKKNAKGSKYSTRFAEVTGVSAQWLDTGRGEQVAVNVIHDQDQTIVVPVFRITASMGSGENQPDGDTIVGDVILSQDWVQKNLISISGHNNLSIITGKGNSMSPTFNDGDVLVVDTGVKEVMISGVYVFSVNNELFIKRISRKLNGELAVHSDNPSEPFVENLREYEYTIHGRVIWTWNGKKV